MQHDRGCLPRRLIRSHGGFELVVDRLVSCCRLLLICSVISLIIVPLPRRGVAGASTPCRIVYRLTERIRRDTRESRIPNERINYKMRNITTTYIIIHALIRTINPQNIMYQSIKTKDTTTLNTKQCNGIIAGAHMHPNDPSQRITWLLYLHSITCL